MTDLDFLSALDAEISAEAAKLRQVSKLEKLRKTSLNNTIPHASRSAAKQEYLALQSEIDFYLWKPEATIALFTEQVCDGCGSVHRTFLQFMEKQVHIKKPSTHRWVRVAKPSPNLPRESMIQPLVTHICADCCEDHGFAISPDCDRLQLSASVSVSATYLQEDINGQD